LPLDQFSGKLVEFPDRTEQVYTSLRQGILSGEFAPGEHIPEVRLARQLRVSRSPVREALRQLVSEGLVVIVPGRGAMVPLPDPVQVQNVFEVRIPLETAAARSAAGRLTPGQLSELGRIEAELGAAGDRGDVREVMRLADRFHAVLYEAGGNPLLSRIIRNLMEMLAVFRGTGPLLHIDVRPFHYQHSELLAALERRDSAGAERAMAEHMRLAAEVWLKGVREWSDDRVAAEG
jgi:DNA-binding GntR family transcriptional regulator